MVIYDVKNINIPPSLEEKHIRAVWRGVVLFISGAVKSRSCQLIGMDVPLYYVLDL